MEKFGRRFVKSNIPRVVLYHNNCPDGLLSAFSFWKKYNPSPIFLGVTYGFPPPEKVRNQHICIVDFSYKRDQMKDLCQKCKSVLVLDHHKTMIENLKDLEEECENLGYVFDVNKCGAEISWEWNFPEQKVPWFIKYIGDRDLWKWELPYSKEINRALYFLKYTYYDYRDNSPPWYKLDDLLLQNEDRSKQALITRGKYILEQEQQEIDIACENSVLCLFEGEKVRLATCSPHLRSEVGNAISDNYDDCLFVCVWRYNFVHDHWYVSLRTQRPNVDLTVYAKKFGGGGHAKACGFTIYGPRSTESPEKKKAQGNLHDYFQVAHYE